MTTTDSTPRVYVGTYAKYNSGSIAGEWLDLTDFSDYDEFIEKCKEIHSDEEDPELMFQDWENDPADFIGESSVSPELWDFLNETKDWDSEKAEALKDWINNGSGDSSDISSFEDDYCGQFKSEQDYAEDLCEQTGMLDSMPENLRYYFDFEKFANDLFMSDYWMSDNGHVFRR